MVEFPVPAFRVTREAGALRIDVPVKPDQFRVLLNLVWLLVWVVGEVAILRVFLGGGFPPGVVSPVPPLVTGIFLAAFTTAGGLVLWRWLWGMGGGETFQITRSALIARREIWGIGRTRTFAFRKIRSVKAERLKYRLIYPSWGRMFIGHEGSEIVVDLDGRTFAYGKGLAETEAGDLIDLLKEEMNYQFREQVLPETRPAFLI